MYLRVVDLREELVPAIVDVAPLQPERTPAPLSVP
jgi:hypothetical protein